MAAESFRAIKAVRC